MYAQLRYDSRVFIILWQSDFRNVFHGCIDHFSQYVFSHRTISKTDWCRLFISVAARVAVPRVSYAICIIIEAIPKCHRCSEGLPQFSKVLWFAMSWNRWQYWSSATSSTFSALLSIFKNVSPNFFSFLLNENTPKQFKSKVGIPQKKLFWELLTHC